MNIIETLPEIKDTLIESFAEATGNNNVLIQYPDYHILIEGQERRVPRITFIFKGPGLEPGKIALIWAADVLELIRSQDWDTDSIAWGVDMGNIIYDHLPDYLDDLEIDYTEEEGDEEGNELYPFWVTFELLDYMS